MKIPNFFYSTAGKADQTADLTFLALQTGFRALDSASDTNISFEKDIGKGLSRFLEESNLSAEDIFIQSQFAHSTEPTQLNIKDQVKESTAISLDNLNIEYLNSLLLNSPMQAEGLSEEDWAVWEAMEQLHKQTKIKYIGVSNFDLPQLAELCDKASVKPKFIQNRFTSINGWDRDIRQFCESNGIIFQGYSILPSNQSVLQHIAVKKLAARYQVTSEQVLFKFCQQIGIIPITGTVQREHMELDLNISELELTPEEVEIIENLSLS